MLCSLELEYMYVFIRMKINSSYNSMYDFVIILYNWIKTILISLDETHVDGAPT